MKLVLREGDPLFARMTIFRRPFREIWVSSTYFIENHGKIAYGTDVVLQMDSGKEIPIIIDDSVEDWKIVYNVKVSYLGRM